MTADSVNAKPPSKRALRKTKERATKQEQLQYSISTKATSQHPEAILKRQQLKGQNKRRRHNFADRASYLTEAERSNDEFDIKVDGLHDSRLTATSTNGSSTTAYGQSISPNGAHKLHSNRVKRLDASTTAEQVVTAIKRAQNLHDHHDIREIAHFLLEEVDMKFGYGFRGSLLSRLAVAALHLNNHDIALRCLTERRISHRSSMLPMESAAIIRGLLRCHYINEAWEVLEDELSLPPEGWMEELQCPADADELCSIDEEDGEIHLETELTRRRMELHDRVVHRARSLGSIVSRHFYESEPAKGMESITKLKEMGSVIAQCDMSASEVGMPWERIIRGAALCEKERRDGRWTGEELEGWPCNIVYDVLDAMIAFPSENHDATFEALCNALVRRTVFVTGACDMNGCPEADRGEVAFIGRSNVGKSSLVNMLTNRKSLAFTSKTPGKTQQFNYFSANDKPDLERQIRYGDEVPGSKDRDAFYIVDLPGFGYAKAPQQQRQQWSDFMDEYLQQRETLRVVFHLVDARLGPTDEDGKIMQKIGRFVGSDEKKNHAKYVVILTKSDKNVKNAGSKNPGRVSKSVEERLRLSMQQNGVGYAPVVLTSSETRLGRDEVWKYLKLAAE